MTDETQVQPQLKSPTITFPKMFYDLGTILPTVKERNDYILGLLSAMFDTDVEDWLTDERVNMLLTTAYERVKGKFPRLAKPQATTPFRT